MYEFELGKFLLANKGLNGYWTSYIILHAPKKDNLHPLEDWLINKGSLAIATRERFYIFQQQVMNYLHSNISLASLPCGLMDDLLTLDYSGISNIKFTGIDLDSQSLALAANNAKKHGHSNVSFLKQDAWNIKNTAQYDLITSNGLNIYEQDTHKVVNLYKEIHKALKQGGILITSFITPPPTLSSESTWQNYDLNDLIKQKVLMSEIIKTKFNVYNTEEQFGKQMEMAGFSVIDVIYDTKKIFPTIVVKK